MGFGICSLGLGSKVVENIIKDLKNILLFRQNCCETFPTCCETFPDCCESFPECCESFLVCCETFQKNHLLWNESEPWKSTSRFTEKLCIVQSFYEFFRRFSSFVLKNVLFSYVLCIIRFIIKFHIGLYMYRCMERRAKMLLYQKLSENEITAGWTCVGSLKIIRIINYVIEKTNRPRDV